MPYKIGFHAGPGGNRTGIGDYFRALDEAGIPAVIKSTDDHGPCGELAGMARASGVKHVIGYRLTTAGQNDSYDYDVPKYNMDPAMAARHHWQATIAKLPPEFDKELVWLEPVNEVDQNRADWLGEFAVEIARLASIGNYKVALFGWSAGEPEPGVWQSEGMIDYLQLCAQRPDRLAVSLHEYSLDSGSLRTGSPWLIGRVNFLFDECRDLGIAKPTVLISEFGWTYNNMPPPAEAMPDLEWAADLYSQHNEILGAGIWYLGGGFNIADEAQRLIAPVTAQALSYSGVEPEVFRYEVWPVDNTPDVGRKWGARPDIYAQFGLPGHGGVDMAAAHGDRIQAVAAGRVVKVGNNPNGLGIHVYLDHEGYNELTGYAHLLATDLTVGRWVEARELIGPADSTGFSTGDHLHFLRKRPGEDYHDIYGDWPFNLHDPTELLRPLAPAEFDQEPQNGRKPATIKHTAHLLPQDTTAAELAAVSQALHPTRTLFTYSHDVIEAVMSHSTPAGKIVAWDGHRWNMDLRARFNWLGVEYEDRAFSDLTPGPAPDPPPEPDPPPIGNTVDLLAYFKSGLANGMGPLYEVQTEGAGQQRHQTQAGQGSAFYHTKDREWEELKSDNLFIYRFTDTSPGNGEYYQLRDGPGGSAGLSDWSKWCPRFMAVNQIYERSPEVTFYRKSDCAQLRTGRQVSFIKMVAIHAGRTGFTGISLADVLELSWLMDPSGQPVESYFYAIGYGLVGWHGAGRRAWVSEIHPPGARPDNQREIITCI